jgi:hypothetical protein
MVPSSEANRSSAASPLAFVTASVTPDNSSWSTKPAQSSSERSFGEFQYDAP